MPTFMKQRRAAIVPMFAVIFPVLMIFCAMAINLAYVQLCHTEMKIAVDAAVHAGGRRLGTPVPNADGTVQTLTQAKADVIDFAGDIAAMNFVAGSPAAIPETVMEFGRSSRNVNDDGSYSPYQFYTINSNQIPSSFRIVSNQLQLPHVFGPFASTDGYRPDTSFTVSAASVSTQVDRDVVLVLDRSGSMIYYEDETGLADKLYELSQETYTTEGEEEVWEYRVQYRSGRRWRNSGVFGYATQAEWDAGMIYNPPYRYRLNYNNRRLRSGGDDEVHDKITWDEYTEASDGLYDRWYSSNVIYWLEADDNDSHTLGDDPDTWTNGLSTNQQRAKLTTPMALYAHDYRYRYKKNNSNINWYEQIDSREAPAFSRWYYLNRGVTVFLNVLGGGVDPDGTSRDGTVQKEQVSILPFNASPDNTNITYGGVNYHDNNTDFDYGLQDDGFPSNYVNSTGQPGYNVAYDGSTVSIRDLLPTICPYGGTAIGDSMTEGAYLIRNMTADDPDARARAFAAKTLVVLTDGDNTVGSNPVDIARDSLADMDLLVHTITFTTGVSEAGKTTMGSVATYGRGKHYHTDSGEALATIFEQIANNLPTILTQ